MTQPHTRERGKRPSRETIAAAALAVVDRDGLEALSMRRVAAELHVDPMMLYRSVPNREGMVADVVDLLLSEIDVRERHGESWDETLMRVHLSEREMALRHPRAYPLVVLAPRDAESNVAWAQALMSLLEKGGLPRDRFLDVWLVDAPYTNGFLLLETTTALRTGDEHSRAAGNESRDRFVSELADTASGDSFARGLKLIYGGLRRALSERESA